MMYNEEELNEMKEEIQKYSEFKNQWVKEHIDYRTMLMTIEQYKLDDQGCDTFEEYVFEYGFFNNMVYPCFNEWFNNEYKEEKEGK